MLPTTVRAAATRFGAAPVFVDPHGQALSFAELDRRSDEVATGLAAAGIGPGTVLGLTLEAGTPYVIAYVAAAKLGAATAGVNPRLTATERERLLQVVDPAVVLTEPGQVEGYRVAGASPPPDLVPDPDRLVAIVFTSGTTGMPKGATFTNRQLEAITLADVGEGWGGGGPGVGATSLAHVGFMTKLPGHLRRGGCSFLLHRWTAEQALQLIADHRMTTLGGVPTQLALLLRHPELDRYDLSAVQSIVLGGGPAPLPLLREARDRIGAPVSVRYSSTESGGCGTGTALDDPLDDNLGVGLPRGPVELAIRTDAGEPLPAGEVGEVCLRSPTAMTGYYRDEAATAAAFWPDGFVRSGDLGYLNETGRLFLAGRGKEMYVRGGYNVYPMEVEAVLLDHPGVAAVAVVARPDEVLGEQGVAVVVPTDAEAPPTLDDLRTFARDRVSSYKLPDDVHLVDALPLTAMDKVDRRALEALIGAQSRER